MSAGVAGRVLITGAAGRIGALLMQHLPKLGWQTDGCDIKPGPGVMVADITDRDEMGAVMKGAEAVIHLAGTPNAKPGWVAVNRLNIHGTRTVLEAARRGGIRRIIFASSIHTVGGHPAGTPFGPDLSPRPSGIYGVSKIAGEALLQVYAAKTGLSCLAVRICSFRPRPANRRELTTWLAPEDCVHLFDRCLAARIEGYAMVWGVSANTGLEIDDPAAQTIGYCPQHDAGVFKREIDARSGDGRDKQWKRMGGPVADDEDDFND